MSLSKRTRFEILKRDGFRCKYCGASALTSLLHVDHVLPRAEGGTDEPANLVTACAACNLGKSDVKLDDSALPRVSAEQLTEQAEQMRGYLEAIRTREGAVEEARNFFLTEYRERVGDWPPKTISSRFLRIADDLGADRLLEAFDAVGRRVSATRMSVRDEARYFSGVIRKMREQMGIGTEETST